jgi:hypothetical protein
MPVDKAIGIMEEECGVSVDPACLQALHAVAAGSGVVGTPILSEIQTP